MYNNELDKIELAALLDGEIRDLARLEQLGQRLADDSDLAAEFEEQRAVKSLLASLPEQEAPDFLATRIMGEIAAERTRRQPRALLRNLGLVGTGFVLCLALVLTFTQFNNAPTGTPQPARDLAFSESPFSWSGDYSMTGVPTPMLASDFDWRNVAHVDGVEDERVQQFIELASKAHSYRILVTSSEAASPDMTDAILVLDQGSVK